MRMGHRQVLVATLASLAMLAAACGGGGGGGGTSSACPAAPENTGSAVGSHQPVTLCIWVPFANPEFSEFKTVVTSFQRQYPWITVVAVPNKNDTDVLNAIHAGAAPDVAVEGIPDNAPKYCSTGAYVDLGPNLKADGTDVTKIVPKGALAYTSYQGNQCMLPMLTDAYGLYYNTGMFQKAGITSPPKTYSELFADVKKLTQLNGDGSIKVAGFLPLATGDYELANFVNGVYSGAQWYGPAGKSTLATDPGFANLLTFTKSMTDWFGFSKLNRFFAQNGGENTEFSPSNLFEHGKLAMDFDGEWRVGFIKNDKSNVPYATAPFPVADDHPELYGVGQIGGSTIGIPRNPAHPAEDWLLVKYLALDTGAEKALAEQLHNIPTVVGALDDPALTQDPHFKTFLDIFANPNSRYKQINTLGFTDSTLYGQFVDKYLAGSVSDLQKGLQSLATQIDQQLQLGA
ncbi:MAG: extracellular solute-binding protein [Actinomycetota bacterium]